MKLKFNPTRIVKDPIKNFGVLEKKTITGVVKKQPIEINSFYAEFQALATACEQTSKKNDLTRVAKRFAETLVGYKEYNLAGIIYSFLVKFNKDNPETVETLATNALAIAQRLHDPVHTMARADDLKRVFKTLEPNNQRMLKILYVEKRALNDIVTNYEGVKNRYRTGIRQMKPIENYRIMLAVTKMQIGELLMATNPTQAKQELQEALEIFLKNGDKVYLGKINKIKNLLA